MANSIELLPPEGHEDVGKRVFEILDEVIKDKKALGLHKKWNRCYEMVAGKHWAKTANIPLVSANLCYRHKQQTVNQLTDNNPTFNISKQGDPNGQYEEAYTNLQRAATHWWVDQEQQDVLESSVGNGETYGICIEKVIFNAELENGLGEAETVIVDPRHFGFYPVKLTDPRMLQKSEAVLHFYPMTVREANRRWPGKNIKGDQTIIKELEDERRNINSEVGTKPASMMVSLATVAKEILNWATDTESAGEELVICEMWVRDFSVKKTTTTEVIEAVGDIIVEEEIIENEEPMYPGSIRYVVACNGKTVLEDRPNPNINLDVLGEEEARKTYLWDKFPFCAVNSVKDTVSAWGMSDIEQLEWLNMEMDKALSQLVLEKDRAARRKWINPLNSGVPNSDFTNFTSILNPVDEKAAAAIRIVDYPAIPVDIQNAITLFKDLFFLISATFEIDQAQLGSNQLAFKSIAALIERVATMMRGKIRSYGRLVRERGRMYLSHVQNFYTEDRWINYEDEQGIQTSGVIQGTQMIVPAKLTVVTGSTLPTSKVQQREEAIQLFQLQAIDRQELLSAMEWSGRSEVIKRMAQGPIGAVMENFAMMGMPQEILGFLQQIASMDPKDLTKGLEDGKIPPFQVIMQQMLAAEQQRQGNAPPAQVDPEIQLKQMEMGIKQAAAAADIEVKKAEIQKIMAEITKIMAEGGLKSEEANSQRVDQQVKIKGVEFDAAKLKMDQARTVAEITKAAKEASSGPIKAKKATVRPKVAGSTPGSPVTTAPPPPIVPETTDKPPGYNEVGLVSNNLEE
jgi:hypothetical protein